MDGHLFDESSLPADLDECVRSELAADERLLWVGQPQLDRFARKGIPIMVFGIPFTAFAIFWIATASGGEGLMGCFPLFGLPFVLIGLGMLSSPYWLRRQAKRTCYALTDRRAILWQAGMFGSIEVRSYNPAALGKVHRREYPDGCGDLVFEEVVAGGRNSDGDRTTSTIRRGFMAIEKVREIETLLRMALLSPNKEGRADSSGTE